MKTTALIKTTACAILSVCLVANLSACAPAHGSVASGRATTHDGRPIPNFEVFYIGTSADGIISGRGVGNNGRYSIPIPANAVVGVYARAITDFDGQKYALEMEATNGKTRDDAEPTSHGIVRDFV